MRKTLRTTAALLALPVLINAVALSDMTPRAQNLPPACNNLYTAQIDGCTSQDWQSQQCSPACSHAMQALVAPIQKYCGGQGIQGQNLIVAFLAGVGPQQLCHNLNSQTTGQTTAASPTSKTSPSPSIVTGSTSTAKSATKTGSLMVDSSSSASGTSTRRTTAKQTKTTAAASNSAVVSSSEAAATTTRTSTVTTSSTQTTSAEGNSQTNLDDGSGGGSPFDTAGNLMNAASGLSVSVASFMMPAVAAALFAVLR